MSYFTVDRAEQTQTLDVGGMREVLCELFIAALLISGSAERAERSVLAGIAAIGACPPSPDAILQATIRAAIKPEMAGGRSSGERETAPAWLPIELARVFLLPAELRQCFVLRLLFGMSRSQCSQLLELDGGELEEQLSSAVLALASIRSQAGRWTPFPFIQAPS